uniref:Cytochrome c oxidase assembly factor 5 n=1 Tax=Globodera rostochiensis TaxID=31243 RepID=A0A914GR80_GLORO
MGFLTGSKDKQKGLGEQETLYDEAVERTGIACDRIRQQLKNCIKGSECIQIKRKKAKECHDELDLPPKCIQLMYVLSECKRNMIDPRARFRGRKGDM